MKTAKIKDLKKGDYFTLKNYGDYPADNRVYIRGDYCRECKKYSCVKFDDMNAETLKGGAVIVYTDFIF